MARKGHHRSLLRDQVDSEAERRAWDAIARLRIELLYASIGYGIYAALSEGGAASARECAVYLSL